MSGLAAAVAFDRDPSVASSIDRMLAAAAYRGPDGVAVWGHEGAALGLFKDNVHGQSPPGPVTDGRRVIAFDGRIDNRADLLARLSIAPAAAPDDAALALQVFGRWGDDAVDAIDGDFALVLWDTRERRLLAVRDHLGVRPLHWATIGDTLFLASDVAQLVAALGAIPPPDESSIADLLSGDPPADERTLFRGLHRVPPGSFMVADANHLAVRQYWSPSPRPAAARTDREYAEECRSIIDLAVEARLRGPGRPAVFFSGGVDSSIVLAIATSICRRGGLQDTLGISLAFEDSAADEAVYQAALARHLDVQLFTVHPPDVDVNELRRQSGRRFCLPDLPSDFAGRRLRTAAKDADARFALTGAGADALFTGSIHRYADLISRGRLVAALKGYATDRTVDSAGWSRGALLTAGVWPLIPARHRTRLRRGARRISGMEAERRWLRLPRPLPPSVPDPPPGVSHATWEIGWSLRSGWTAYFLESAERIDAELGVQERHPLLDRRLVEFALRLPESQRYRGGLSKVVLRRAVPELPPMIGQRRIKADFSALMRDNLATLGGSEFFRSLAIAEQGWVDGTVLAARYDRLVRVPTSDRQAERDLPMLWMTAATEVWFRAMYDQQGVSR